MTYFVGGHPDKIGAATNSVGTVKVPSEILAELDTCVRACVIRCQQTDRFCVRSRYLDRRIVGITIVINVGDQAARTVWIVRGSIEPNGRDLRAPPGRLLTAKASSADVASPGTARSARWCTYPLS